MNVVNFGGGVNSTAMVVGLLERKEPIDLVLFADTGNERPETYEHRDVMVAFLKERGVTFVSVTNAGRGQGATLGEDCLRKKELPSLAYNFRNKGCSVKWKRQPMDRFLRGLCQPLFDKGEKVTRCIGIDAGETSRHKLPPDKFFIYRYPLVEWNWDRDDCIAAIKQAGLPVPPKSSCTFCPATRPNEVLDLAEDHPDLFAAAVAMEKNADLHTIKGLGGDWSWESLVRADRAQLKLFPPRPPSPCDCMDGEEE